MQGWLPGEHGVTTTIAVTDEIAAGAYSLDVGVVAPTTRAADVPIAIAGRLADGWYSVGRVTVERR